MKVENKNGCDVGYDEMSEMNNVRYVTRIKLT